MKQFLLWFEIRVLMVTVSESNLVRVDISGNWPQQNTIMSCGCCLVPAFIEIDLL